MKLLILGGTQFLGRHMAEQALAAGHEVTLFNRGSQGRRLMAGVEQLQGDRRGDLSILRGRRWDAVLDPSCYLPSAGRARWTGRRAGRPAAARRRPSAVGPGCRG